MVDNNKKIILAIERRRQGLTITNLVTATRMNRTQVRTAISFLLGAKKIEEHKIGMAKLYTIIF